jgi:hypothetical protein
MEVYKDTRKLVKEKLFNQKNARVTNNIAAVYTGLILFRAFVRTMYGDGFDTRFEALFDSLLDPLLPWNTPYSTQKIACCEDSYKVCAIIFFQEVKVG